ncbi:MAG TPA: RraA family protein [Xanthobacteraceae bacterium]|jgi:regulator of RNase E activity RraA|nr:RraA family protein [Xanthobacteraceae bacterium]
MAKQTLGKLPPDAFGMLDLPALPHDLIEGFRNLPDLTGTTSDVMDELGIVGAVPAAVLRPNDPSARVVGRALTVRNIAASATVPDKVKAGVSGLGEIEAHNLAEPGDVLVVQGVDRVSNLGGMSATIGHRQGEIGAIVDGGARDVDHSRTIGLPVWSKSVSPITGKWRVETVAVNKPVTICGVTVNPGDVVLADESGVCFVPRQRAAEVLARAQRNAAAEKLREEKIASGVPIAELIGKAK